MNESRVQQKVRAGGPALGLAVHWPTGGTIEAIGAAWDFMWIDIQHGLLDYGSVSECVRACELVGTSALVRVPGHSYEEIGPILDLAPAGIIVPMVNTAEQARQIVRHARFAPLGQRSYGGRRIIDRHGRDYVQDANERQLLIVQIETIEAVPNAAAIAATEGVDALLYGPDDLRVTLGLSMDAPLHEGVIAEHGERVVRAAQVAGKAAMVPAAHPDSLRWALRVGFRLLVCGSDVGFVKTGSASARAMADQVLHGS